MRPTRRPDWRQATEEVWRRRGFTDVHGSALRHLPTRVGWPGRSSPGEATGLGQLSGLLPAGDLLMYAVSCGAGRWLVRTRGRIRGSGCGSLLASCRPVLAVADRAGSIAPIGVQLVKYVLHLLNGTGRPARGAGCPHGNRRGSGAGRPPWLWPPGRGPERNRRHRCQKGMGQRNVRRHQVLHNALPQLWTATAGGVRLTDEPSPPRTLCGVRALPQGPGVPAY